MHRLLWVISGTAYVIFIIIFAFRPFSLIPGLGYPDADPEFRGGGVHLRAGVALEEQNHVSRVRKSLMDSGKMALAVSLKPMAWDQQYPAPVISYSRDCSYLNFTLAQHQHDGVFLLRTSRAGEVRRVTVSNLFDAGHRRHLVITYDGELLQFFLDGKPVGEGENFEGDFSGWGRNHALIIGDEPFGGRPWYGCVYTYEIYDRPLNEKEVARLSAGLPIDGAVLSRNFSGEGNLKLPTVDGLVQLKYRNLFIFSDQTVFSLKDCVENIAGFLPLGFFAVVILPFQVRRRLTLVSYILVPAVAGLLVSGSIEWCQQYLVGRVPNALDLIYNIGGSISGSLLTGFALSNPVMQAIFKRCRFMEQS